MGIKNPVQVHSGKNCLMCQNLQEVERLTAILHKRSIRTLLVVDKEAMRALKYSDVNRKKRFEAVHGKDRRAKGASLKKREFSYKMEDPVKDSLARVRTIQVQARKNAQVLVCKMKHYTLDPQMQTSEEKMFLMELYT